MDVDLMTSKDFHIDAKAHIESMSQLLKDEIRIKTFKEAILYNKHLFRGRIVLNLNCSLGIYALFAAKAGAAKVYAIDNSNVIDYMQHVVQKNGYTDIIEIIKGNVEEVELPEKEVDIILCDWMGYALLYQSTCVDVIYARDKWLKKRNGLIFPDTAKIYLNIIEDKLPKTANIDWWRRVYGFNMNCIREAALKEPKYKTVQPEQILSEHCHLKTINMYTATLNDLNYRNKFVFHIGRSGEMDGIVLYFDVFFNKCHRPLLLSTNPWSPLTNWLQTVCYFDQHVQVQCKQIYYGYFEFLSQISVCGRRKKYLNEVVINVEMLTGDFPVMELIAEMSWYTRSSHAMYFDENPSVANLNQAVTIDTETMGIKPPNGEEPNERISNVPLYPISNINDINVTSENKKQLEQNVKKSPPNHLKINQVIENLRDNLMVK